MTLATLIPFSFSLQPGDDFERFLKDQFAGRPVVVHDGLFQVRGSGITLDFDKSRADAPFQAAKDATFAIQRLDLSTLRVKQTTAAATGKLIFFGMVEAA